MTVTVLVIVIALVPLLAWYGLLFFLAWVSTHADDKTADVLKAAAVATRAFPFKALSVLSDRFAEPRATPRREIPEGERHLNALPSEPERLPRRPA